MINVVTFIAPDSADSFPIQPDTINLSVRIKP